MELTEFDKELLNELQKNLPIVSRPFAELAQKLEVEESFVIERIGVLKKEGFIRRMGAFFNSEQLGYEGTLVALKVEQDHMRPVAEKINNYSGVTHNYERAGSYNLWFTLLTPSLEDEKRILEEIQNLDGVEELRSFKSQKKYKINVQLALK